MSRSLTLRVLTVTIMLVALAGCANRGVFGPASCSRGDRVPVHGKAVAAIYFDTQGNPLGTRAENMKGTLMNQMCPTPPHPDPGPDVCPPGYCSRTVSGKAYCLPC